MLRIARRSTNHYPILFLIVFTAVLRASSIAEMAGNGPLQPVGAIALEGVEGRIDHMAASPDGRWLFVAALGSNQVEIIDTNRRVIVASLKDIKEPQGLYYLAKMKRLAVASGGEGKLFIYSSKRLPIAAVSSVPDADNLRYEESTGLLYLGYGSGALAIIRSRAREQNWRDSSRWPSRVVSAGAKQQPHLRERPDRRGD